MINQKYTKNIKIIKNVIKNSDRYSEKQITDLIQIIDKWINSMPEVLQNNLFSTNRKLTLLNLKAKLQIINSDKLFNNSK